MAQPKFRPSLTLDEIQSLVSYIETGETEQQADLTKAINTLKLTLAKADLGAISPAYVPTGTKPGRVSAVELVTGMGSTGGKKQDTGPDYSNPANWAQAYTDFHLQVSLGMTPSQELANAASNWEKLQSGKTGEFGSVGQPN